MALTDRYLIEEPIASGGMGTIFRGRHLTLGTSVAIKRMMPQYAEDAVLRARFEREAKASAKLQSPHIVTVYDYGIDDDAPYLVMELLEGENLGEHLRRYSPMEPRQFAPILRQICLGLSVAHAHGVVHRDLKPSNLFVVTGQPELLVKILDFGIAKAATIEITGEVTTTNSIVGSPQYMSPEQIRASRDADARSDLWSIAVVCYRALIGEIPFKGRSIGDYALSVCSDPIPSARSRRPSLPETADAFFHRAFSRDPEGRFQTAEDFYDGFAQAFEIDPSTSLRRDVTSSVTARTATTAAVTVPSPSPSQPTGGTLTDAGSLITPTRRPPKARLALLSATIFASVVLLGVFTLAPRVQAPLRSSGLSRAVPRAMVPPTVEPLATKPEPTSPGSAAASVGLEAGAPSSVVSATASARSIPPSPRGTGRLPSKPPSWVDLGL